MSSCSVGDAGFIGVRPGGRRVRSELLVCALGVVAFVRGRWVHSWRSSHSFGVAEFIGVPPGGRRVRSGSLGSFLEVVAFVRGG